MSHTGNSEKTDGYVKWGRNRDRDNKGFGQEVNGGVKSGREMECLSEAGSR